MPEKPRSLCPRCYLNDGTDVDLQYRLGQSQPLACEKGHVFTDREELSELTRVMLGRKKASMKKPEPVPAPTVPEPTPGEQPKVVVTGDSTVRFSNGPKPREISPIDCARLAGLLGDFTDSSSLFGAVFALNQELRDTKELLAMAQGVTEGTGDVTIQLTIPERHVASIKDVAEANEMDIGRYMNLRVTEGLDAMWFV